MRLAGYSLALRAAPTDASHSQVLLDEKSSDIRKLLVRLFDVVIKFCNIQNRLYDVVLSEAERLARRKELRQKRLEKVCACLWLTDWPVDRCVGLRLLSAHS